MPVNLSESIPLSLSVSLSVSLSLSLSLSPLFLSLSLTRLSARPSIPVCLSIFRLSAMHLCTYFTEV